MPHINIRDKNGKLIDSWPEAGHNISLGQQLNLNNKPYEIVAHAKRNRHTEVNVKPVKAS